MGEAPRIRQYSPVPANSSTVGRGLPFLAPHIPTPPPNNLGGSKWEGEESPVSITIPFLLFTKT